MTPNDIKHFKKEIADPRMRDIFANTEIPAGSGYIDSLNIQFLDGRSCGVESVIEASGVVEKDGKIEKFDFYAQDITVAEFANEHRDYFFLGEGNFRVFDELDDLEINGKMWNYGRCTSIFQELASLNDLSFISPDFVYMKMNAILQHDPFVQHDNGEKVPTIFNNAASENLEQRKGPAVKPSLDQMVQTAAKQITENNCNSSHPERDGR